MTLLVSLKHFVELKALCELLGPYGIRHLGDKCMHQVMGQVLELKVCVVVFLEIQTCFDVKLHHHLLVHV